MCRISAIALVLLVGCSPPGQTLTGTFRLTQDEPTEQTGGGLTRLTHCSGTGGYRDITEGLNVTVRNQDGTILGTDSLTIDRFWESTPRACQFSFEVADVPLAEFYTIEVGRRGDLTYSLEELQEMDWNVELTIGD